jgi:lipid II:glycine glycyltransferase (peptidoglycan interpeptide bridge formation enzyme)
MEPDKENWDSFAALHKGSLLQSWAWGQFQKTAGNAVLYLKGNGWQGVTISRSLPMAKKFLYVPYGPVCEPGHEQEAFKEIAEQARAASRHALFLKLEPGTSDARTIDMLLAGGFVRAAKSIQPQDSMIIDLDKSEKELLDGFKEICRRRIKEAQKKNVAVAQDNSENGIREFLRLIHETGLRDSFRPHAPGYYRSMIETLYPAKQAELFLASMKGKTIAGAIIGYFGDSAYYLHAASESIQEFRPSHAVIWEAIKSAKQRGCAKFDLYGVAPIDAGPQHPWTGITKFKETFNARRVHYIGGFDFPFSKLWYRAYRTAKHLRSIQ